MKKFLKYLFWTIGGIIGLIILLLLTAHFSDHGKVLLPVEHTPTFQSDQMSTYPSQLQARGNQLVNATGEAINLQGLMVIDPAVMHKQNRFHRQLFENLQATGANIIRIPIHPEHWKRDPDYLWRYLEPAARWTGELGMYLIIDWHSIGNIETGRAPLMQDLYCHTKEMTLEFWELAAGHFKDAPHLLFEIFNEPQGISANYWQRNATEIVQLIRQQGAEQLIIVGGITYGQDLSWVHDQPIPDANIAYASHIYPAHSRHTWDARFGNISKKYPVLITEWGYMEESKRDRYLVGSEENYAQPFLQYLDEHQIGWTACWYSDDWRPPMFVNYEEELTSFGKFVMERLQQNRTQD